MRNRKINNIKALQETMMVKLKRRLRNMGFTVIEIAIAMGVIAVLTAAITPSVIKSFQIKAAEKTALEIVIIQDAARNYYFKKNSWPNSFEQLHTLELLNKDWQTINPWLNPYTISANDSTFSVSTTVPSEWTGLVARYLPQVIIKEDLVTSTVVSPGGDDGIKHGVIVAWSGLTKDIPDEWRLCDGSHGTPDLRNKFILGSVNDNGANIFDPQVYLKEGGVVAHSHGGKTGEHRLTIAEMPRHHHGYMASPWTGARYDGHSSPLLTQQIEGQTDDTGGDLPHSHTISQDFNVPPFYSLAFIMKCTIKELCG